MSREHDLERIGHALDAARAALAALGPAAGECWRKAGGELVTRGDLAVNETLRTALARPGEGWLSEESADDPARSEAARVWIVDPIDGTRQFVDGTPEWCIAVALVESGTPVAGGILNPATDQLFLGASGCGLRLNGVSRHCRESSSLDGAEILASRSEVRQGLWRRWKTAPFRARPIGSVAYKLALVAAGEADATWSVLPKNEWDVAAGVALVLAGGGSVWLPDGMRPVFNRPDAALPGLCAAGAGLAPALREYLGNEWH